MILIIRAHLSSPPRFSPSLKISHVTLFKNFFRQNACTVPKKARTLQCKNEAMAN